MIVHVHKWRSWISAAGRDSFDVPWRYGMVAADVVPPVMSDKSGLRVFVNGEACACPAFTRISPRDHVDVALMPADPGTITIGSLTIKALIGNSLILSTILGAGAILLANHILRKLLAPPKGPKKKDDDESATSGWSGSTNVRVEGQPRKVIYGMISDAPTIIDEFIVTRPSPFTSVLYTLGTHGEGPVHSIGDKLEDNPTDEPFLTGDSSNPIPTGIQINGNSLENYRDVEAHVRMGNEDQLPVPGFEKIATEHSVSAELTQAETEAALGHLQLNADLPLTVAIPYNSNDPDAQAVWDAYGFSFDILHRADRFTALVSFPRGLFRITSTGDLADGAFQGLIRYRELDGDGLPILQGGDNGDGWVYVPPEPMLLAATQDPFAKEFSGVFMDPQNFTPGELGRACFFDGTNDYATTNLGANDTLPNSPASWAAGSSPDEMTVTGWFQFDGLPAGGGSTLRPLFEMSDPASPNRGVALGLFRVNFVDGGGSGVKWVPGVYTGNGSAVTLHHWTNPYGAIYVPHSGTGLTPFHHIAYTYRKLTGSNSVLSIYLNGLLAYTTTGSTARIVAAGKALELGRSRTFDAGVYSDVRIDEVKVYDRELTAVEIEADYNDGRGTYGTADADLVAGWHFDEPVATATAQDYGNYQSISSQNDLRLLNGAGDGAAGSGWVIVPGTGPVKRARYRVQLLRANLKSKTTFVADESVWSLLYGKIDAVLAYPGLALLATKIKANTQLEGSAPKITSLVKGVLCPVWDGLSTTNPGITYQWTQNPAWICLDIATNKRYGRGSEYDFLTVDLPSLKEMADYADEFIYDNRGQRQGIHELDDDFPIQDIRHLSTLFDGFGGLEVYFRSSPTIVAPPRRWTAGRFIGFTGIPGPTGAYTVDITGISGFEIGSVEFTGGGWVVNLKYDTNTYGMPWTDGQFLSTYIALAGVAEGRERRFEYNWVHDTFKSFWDTLVDVASTARSMPIRDGRRLRFKTEKPRSAVGLIGMGSIIPETFEITYAGVSQRTNSIQADYWDQDKNYDRANVSMDDPALELDTPEEDLVRESITIEGITRRSQVKRHLYFMLLVSRILGRRGKFKAAMETLPFEAGDVFQLAHNIVQWGKSGRILAASTTTELFVDREITLAPGVTYYAKVRGGVQTQEVDGTIVDQTSTVEITEAAGTYASGTGISIDTLSFTPSKDDPYVIYSLDEIRLVQIASISLGQGGEREIEWIEYDEAVYDCDELPEDLTE
jgi:hypothetical protein